MRGKLHFASVFGGFIAMALLPSHEAVAKSEGLYLDLRGGAMFVQDADNEQAGVSLETSYDPGYSIVGAVGYDFGDFRLEGEISYRSAEIDETSAFGGSADSDGDVYAGAAMINAYYDFDLGSPWKPYLGGGVGGAIVGFDEWEIAGLEVADDDDLVFAFQAAAGLGYEFTDNLTLYGGYRFFGTTEPELEDAIGFDFDSEFYSHNIEVGFRFTF